MERQGVIGERRIVVTRGIVGENGDRLLGTK